MLSSVLYSKNHYGTQLVIADFCHTAVSVAGFRLGKAKFVHLDEWRLPYLPSFEEWLRRK